MIRYKNKDKQGFTLIELLVVVAIISLLTSIALIALVSARQKSRNTKRLSDMVQMGNVLELYFATHKGYPTGTNVAQGVHGVPQDLVPNFAQTLPKVPQPPDEACLDLVHTGGLDTCVQADSNCNNVQYNTYYYVASGTPYTISGKTIYPDYAYYFCLGHQTGNFSPGLHILTPRGVR